ncbi:HNH endonuclease [Phaeobacter inhibens]|nr:HNH endonuclease [Phaeobacter inhibens]UWR97710.1 HNH endonuclease [Phaeobacter inhibens]UWS05639.1 HNH endonuclease [Phaeobacter inhibens]UWS06770.1 HNH endonuclease [Phaeobacter inhibens]
MSDQHPFSGRNGSAARDRLASVLYAQQGGKCRMCSRPIPPSLRGKTGKRAAVVDHLRPWRLRPDLAFELTNLGLVCAGCHFTHCASIEAAHAGDAELIAQAKERIGQEW